MGHLTCLKSINLYTTELLTSFNYTTSIVFGAARNSDIDE